MNKYVNVIRVLFSPVQTKYSTDFNIWE